MKSLLTLPPSLGLAFLLVGCGATETNDRCLVTDLAEVTARTDVIGVGDTVTLQASLVQDECRPVGLEPVEWRWSSSDTLVVSVDSLTGLARGAGSGMATILVQHARALGVQGSLQLEVVSASPAAIQRVVRVSGH